MKYLLSDHKHILKRLIVFLILIYPIAGSALHPSKTYKQTPADFNLKYEQLSIRTYDGASLNAWYVPANSNKMIILSHDGVENMGNYLDRVKAFHQSGFNILTYDYRGFGQSSDFVINNYQYIYQEFFTDFDAVVSYGLEKLKKDIVVYGWGIGGGIAITNGYQHPQILGIIADDPFLDFGVIRTKFKSMNAVMEVPVVFDNKKYQPQQTVQNNYGKNLRGILYFHGSQNLFATVEDMDKLLEQTTLNNKKLVPVNQSRYVGTFNANKSKYTHEVYYFVMNL